MERNIVFPIDLLSKDITERINYFENQIIDHRILSDTIININNIIEHPTSTQVILVFGPTGVGKTTIWKHMKKKLHEKFLSQPNRDPGQIYLVSLEAPSRNDKYFYWKDFNKRVLLTLEEPLIDKKIDYFNQKIYRDSEGKLVLINPTNNDLGFANEIAFINRKVKVFMIDEANHCTKLDPGLQHIDYMNTFKSFSNITKTLIILFGTYELSVLGSLNGQLSRRSKDIHFRRYIWQLEEDQKEYINIIYSFLMRMPLENTPDMSNYYDYIYKRSLGCVGILRDWFADAFKEACKENAKTLTYEHLESTGITTDKLLVIAEEIRSNEEKIFKRMEGLETLEALLKIDKKNEKLICLEDNKRGKNKTPENGFHQRKPGDRNPTRDPVGKGQI